VNAKGEECGLSEPSLKIAVRVNSVVAPVKETGQSKEVAVGVIVWQANTPSW